jgi:hypothetical protein
MPRRDSGAAVDSILGAGLVTLNSSPVIMKGRVCTVPSRFGNELASSRMVEVLFASPTVYVPNRLRARTRETTKQPPRRCAPFIRSPPVPRARVTVQKVLSVRLLPTHRDAMAVAPVGVVVPQRMVLRAAVVPKCNRVRRPLEAHAQRLRRNPKFGGVPKGETRIATKTPR